MATQNQIGLSTWTQYTVVMGNGIGSPLIFSGCTYPNTTTINQLLYSSASNAITGLATANNGVLITSAGGVPSISSTLPTAVTGNITTLGTITSGTWNGSVIGLAFGGTNANLVASNGGIFYSTASAGAILSGTATANQILLSGSSTAPAWSTVTHPATTTINQILYSSAANVLSGLATANNGVLITSAGGVPSISSTIPSATQLNITQLGTVTSGTWNAGVIGGTYGGTGVNNGASTITIGGNFAMSGSFAFTGILTGTTSVTFPTSGTLATTASIPALPVSLANGGTNANLVASNGGIFYSTASAGAILAGTATANQMLLSGASMTPAWSTATYPATTTINQILYSSANNVIAGLATANSGTLVTSGAGVPSIQALTAGQILIGTTASAPAAATLTQGTGITITSATGAITIAASSNGGFIWNNQASSSVTMAAGNGYIINNGASLVTLTVASAPTIGDTYKIVGFSSGGWKIAQNASQQIICDGSATTAGVGGYVQFNQQYDCITITYCASNIFVVNGVVGGPTVN